MADDCGTIRLPIGRHPVDRKRMSTHSRRSREAETAWNVVQRWDRLTLLQVHLKTGRTHQIRVHCAAIGRPIVGDPVYGQRRTPADSAWMRVLLDPIRRQMLHAWRLEFIHPHSGETMHFESALPEDMTRLIAALEAGSRKAEGGREKRENSKRAG
jgi:23S rRNA pseudouridine1911/1915/1917 synthase